jgi:hypothetical protein
MRRLMARSSGSTLRATAPAPVTVKVGQKAAARGVEAHVTLANAAELSFDTGGITHEQRTGINQHTRAFLGLDR